MSIVFKPVRRRELNKCVGVSDLAKILLRDVDNQVLSGEGEVRAAAAFHVLGRGLRQGGNDDGQSDGRVTIHISGKRAAAQFSINKRFVERDGARSAAGMRRVGGKLNRVFMS